MKKISVISLFILAFLAMNEITSAEYEGWLPVPGTSPQLYVRPGHPRMILTPDNLPNLKCRAGISNAGACPVFGSASGIYTTVGNAITSWANGDLADLNAGRPESIDSRFIGQYAFMYQLTGNSMFCQVVAGRLTYDSGRGYVPAEEGLVYSTAYDWCYGYFSATQREQFGAYLLSLAQVYPYTYRVDAPHNVWTPNMYYHFAIFGDPFSGNDDAFTGSNIRQYLEDGYKSKYIPAYNRLMCDGGIDGYGGTRTNQMRWAAELFTTATSYTTMFEDSQLLENSALFYISKLRADLALTRNPAKFNTAGTYIPGYMSQFAARYNDPHAQWMANYYVTQSLYNYQDDIVNAWEVLLWDDPSRAAQPLTSLPTVRRGTCSGMNYIRSDWNIGPSSQSVFAAFFNMPQFQGHQTQNHFLISRGDDSLLIDSGYRAGDLDWSYQSYYDRTVAHNSVLIFDPNEDFGIDDNHPGYSRSNDGGQCCEDMAEGCLRWPEACNYVGYRGEITHYEDAPTHTYFVGDATVSYRSTKTDKVIRSFVYLKPDKFVVFDKVNSLNPAFPKRVLLHMIEKPLVDGTLQTVEGNPATGGIFTSTNSDLVTVKYGDSALLSRILLPQNKVVRLIGGQNADGDPVRQNFLPSYAQTYSPSQSYEYYVNGRLYPPGPDLYDPYEVYVRNSDPVASEAGDWRVEIEPAAQQNYDTFLQVMQVRDGDLEVNDDSASFSLTTGWSSIYNSQTSNGMYKAGKYRKDHADGVMKSNPGVNDRATWSFTLPQTGNYEVLVWLPKPRTVNYATNALYTVRHPGGESSLRLSQNQGKAAWVSLGIFALQQGAASVELSGDAANNIIVADAVKLVYKGAPLSMVPTSLITSSNNNMQGALISTNKVVLFSRDGTDITSTTFNVASTGTVDFLLFDAVPSAGYTVSVNGQVVTVTRTGAQYTSSSEGVLSFSATLGGGADPNAVIPGSIVVDPATVNTAGLAWFITGDADNDAEVAVEYRESGTSTWRQALPLFMVENRVLENGVNPGHLLAGSVFDLEEDTLYEFRLTLSDDDGGYSQQTATSRTRKIPAQAANPRIRYVSPGSGGGSGTQADPFRGLAAADAASAQGDVFLLNPGTYSPATFTRDGTADAPIVYRGLNKDAVIVDGAGTSGIILSVGSRDHLFFENMTVRNGRLGISGADTQGMVIKDMHFLQITKTGGDSIAIFLSGNSQDAYIVNNTLDGVEVWPTYPVSPEAYGILIGGTGHVIAYNTLSSFWDGVDTIDTANAIPNIAIDIYNNTIVDGLDDSVETDGSLRNVRVFRNTFLNSLKGVSAQPVYGGPIYIIRNNMFNMRSSALKFHQLNHPEYGLVSTTGLVVYHNSMAVADRPFNNGDWRNAQFRNNIFYGTAGYVMETLGTFEDFDYDAWAPKQLPVLKFNNVRYQTINADCGNPANTGDFCAQTGNEEHAVTINAGDFVNLPEPQGAAQRALLGDWDFALQPASGAIDSAQLLPNINDDYAGAGPDRGAFEYAAPSQEPTCAVQSGDTCLLTEYCPGTYVPASDTDRCCNQVCVTCDVVDTDCDGDIENGELAAYISTWFSGSISISEVIGAIERWKQG